MLKKRKERMREQIDRTALLSYLHHGGAGLHSEQEMAIETAIDEVIAISNPRAIAHVFRLASVEKGVALQEGPTLLSQDLARTLTGAEEVAVVACTLGHEVMRQIKKRMMTRPSEGVLFDAAASALVEALAEVIHRDLPRSKEQTVGIRYSPGYGDLSLESQEELLALIGAQERLGIHTNAGHLMIPEKSILFLVGIGPEGLMQTSVACDHRCLQCDAKLCLTERSRT